MSDDPILAALVRLEAGQASMRADFMAELGKTRADIMERIDRQQARLDSIDEHLLLGLGYTGSRGPQAGGVDRGQSVVGRVDDDVDPL